MSIKTKLLIITLLIITLFTLFFHVLSEGTISVPKKIDFGVIENRNGKFISFQTIKISNMTKTNLKIIEINSSCGCLSVINVSPETIKGGEIGIIFVKMELTSKDIVGRKIEVIIKTDNRKKSIIKIDAYGRVKNTLSSSRELIDFGNINGVSRESSMSFFINYFSDSSEKSVIPKISTSNPFITITIVKSSGEILKTVTNETLFLHSWECIVTLHRNKSNSSNNKESVSCSVPDGTHLEIPIIWKI